MKVLMCTPWKNTWVSYWTEAWESAGHEVRWHINRDIILEDVKKELEWCDVVLSHWADKYAMMLSDPSVNTKPLYVILRSYEVFSAEGWSDLGLISWGNVKHFFMLNEAHLHPFSCRVPNVRPTFFKNGVDLEEWKYREKTPSAMNKIAWICDVNEKKGVELCVQAMHELNKVAPSISLEHIGRNQDVRRMYYLDTIMPKLNCRWYNTGYKNEHQFVQNFLANKGFIISSSIAEGNPMNIIEAMACGVVPLVHRWPGAEYQFPEELLWGTFDELKTIYQRELKEYSGVKVRQYAEKHYDYRRNYRKIIDVVEADNKKREEPI